MSPPIRDGSGNSIGAIRLGDGSEISEVRTGAGDVLFSAIPDSAISRYEFEQDFTDSIDGNDGNPINNPSFTTDNQVGTFALELTGSEYIELGNPSNLAFTANDAFSVAVWVNADSWPGPDNRSHWVSSRNGNSNFSTISSRNSSDLRWSVVGDSNVSNVITTPPATGTWNLLTGTYDGNGNVEFYFNDANSQGTGSGSISGDVYSFWNIGNREDFNRRPDGRIDDVRFYSKELSASEVSDLFNTGSI